MAMALSLLPLLLFACPSDRLHGCVDAAISPAFVNNFAGAVKRQEHDHQHSVHPEQSQKHRSGILLHATSTTTEPAARSAPRTGIAQQLLNLALASPLWEYVLVPQARASIVKTAEENGIPWVAAKEWLRSQKDAPWNTNENDNNSYGGNNKYGNMEYPEYYQKSFHAYSEGNLSYDAAFEQELASRAIGARNFPKYSDRGEDVFRGAFDQALLKLGAGIDSTINAQGENEITIVDFGCGTGTSTRRLAKQYPQATQLIGIDLSPYFIDVGNTLLELAPSAINIANGNNSQEGWITDIEADKRIQLRQGDIAKTKLPSNSVSVVNLSLVLHELPISAAREVLAEAYRILKPGGQVWISEMDFESPAYKAQRENAMLFSLLRATEPYLDVYADGMAELREYMMEMFDVVKITAATGRHYALLAEKGGATKDKNANPKAVIEDTRFREDGIYAIEDTHLKPWESKVES